MPTLLFVALLVVAPTPEAEDEFPKSITDAAIAATVRITNGDGETEGSGVIIGHDGPLVYVLTAEHVVRGSDTVVVHSFSADGEVAGTFTTGRVVARFDEAADVAIVRFSTRAEVPTPACLCPVKSLPKAAGFVAYWTGCPAGVPPKGGQVKVVARTIQRRENSLAKAACWEVDRRPVKGQSGGPLFDREGRVIGVCSAGRERSGYYSHIENVDRLLKANDLIWLSGTE